MILKGVWLETQSCNMVVVRFEFGSTLHTVPLGAVGNGNDRALWSMQMCCIFVVWSHLYTTECAQGIIFGCIKRPGPCLWHWRLMRVFGNPCISYNEDVPWQTWASPAEWVPFQGSHTRYEQCDVQIPATVDEQRSSHLAMGNMGWIYGELLFVLNIVFW